jgi:uncharacterized RDD family membrane protein YckC
LLGALIDGIIIGLVGGVLRALSPALGAIGILIGLAYYVYFEGSPSGQTIGKRAMNIRIIDYTNGGPIGYGRATLRYFARILSVIPCFLGYFWMLWDREKQCWHDKISTDVVVPTSAYPVSSWPG